MALSTSELYLILRARDEASRVVRGFTSTLSAEDRKVAAIQAATMRRGQALATVGVGIAIAGVVGINALNKMTNSAIEYHQQVALTKTQVDGLNISIGELGDMGLDVARKLPVAFEKIQLTLYDIFSSIKVDAKEAALLLENIGKASIGGNADMQVVGRATIAILNSYKMEAKEVTKVNDTMFQLVRKGVGTYDEFTAVIGRVVPSAVKAGQTFETTAGMMAFLTRNGMSAAMASTSAARALDSISKPSTIKNLRDMGVQVIDSTGNFRPMVDIIHDLKGKLSGLPGAVQAVKLNEVFKGSGANIQTMRFLNLAINDTNNLFGQMVGAMGKAKGEAKKAYDAMANTPAAKILKLKNEFHTLGVEMGAKLIPVKKVFLTVLIAMGKILNWLPGPVKSLIVGFFAFVAVVLLLTGVIIAWSGVMVIANLTMLKLHSSMVGTMIVGFQLMILKVKTLTISLGQNIALWALYAAQGAKSMLISISKMIAGFLALGLKAMASALTQLGAWILVRTQMTLTGNLAKVTTARIIAAWIAMRIAAMANATRIAAAWLISMGPAGWVALAGVGIVAGVGAIWLAIAKLTKKGGETVSYQSYRAGQDISFSFAKGLADGKKKANLSNALSAISEMFGGKPISSRPHLPKGQYPKGGGKSLPVLSAAQRKVIDANREWKKILEDLLNPPKEKGPGAGNKPIADKITLAINTLKSLIRTGAKDITAAMDAMPDIQKVLGKGSTAGLTKNIADVQKAIDELGKLTPNQLKKMGVDSVQKLIDGLKSKEAALKETYTDLLYKTLLNVQTKTQALAAQGATAINAFLAKGTGDLGKDSEGMKIAFELGADVVGAYAEGMKSEDPTARLAARNALVDSIQSAYETVLDKLKAIHQAIVDKMIAIQQSISSTIMTAVNFGNVYTKAMDKAKKASEKLATENQKALDKIQKAYEKHMDKLSTTLQKAENKLTTTASSITSGIMGALDFGKAASDANMNENSFLEQLVEQAKKAQDFGAIITKLVSMGLSADAIVQIANAGIDAGTLIAQSLIDGGVKAIQDTNALVKSVTDLADSLGTTTAERYYATGVSNAQAAIDGYIATMGPESPYIMNMIATGEAAVIAMANVMGESFNVTLQEQANAATAYADKIKKLVEMGLSVEALTQVLAAGDVAGNAIADSLIAGGTDAITATNKILDATQKVADAIGIGAAERYYAAGLANATSMLNGFVTQYGPEGLGRKALMTAMDDIAKSMNRTSTITINTVYTGTGNPNGGGGGGDLAALQAAAAAAIAAANKAAQDAAGNLGGGADARYDQRIAAEKKAAAERAIAEAQAAETKTTTVTVNAPITLTEQDPAAWAASLGWHLTNTLRSE